MSNFFSFWPTVMAGKYVLVTTFFWDVFHQNVSEVQFDLSSVKHEWGLQCRIPITIIKFVKTVPIILILDRFVIQSSTILIVIVWLLLIDESIISQSQLLFGYFICLVEIIRIWLEYGQKLIGSNKWVCFKIGIF